MAPPHRVQTSPDEGKKFLALTAVKTGQCANISAAAKLYSVPKSKLYYRIHGATLRENFKPVNEKMNKKEEEVLVKELLKLYSQGLSPTINLV